MLVMGERKFFYLKEIEIDKKKERLNEWEREREREREREGGRNITHVVVVGISQCD